MSFHGYLPQGITASTAQPPTSSSSTYMVLFSPFFKANKPCGRRALFSFLAATAAGPQEGNVDSKKSLFQGIRRLHL